ALAWPDQNPAARCPWATKSSSRLWQSPTAPPSSSSPSPWCSPFPWGSVLHRFLPARRLTRFRPGLPRRGRTTVLDRRPTHPTQWQMTPAVAAVIAMGQPHLQQEADPPAGAPLSRTAAARRAEPAALRDAAQSGGRLRAVLSKRPQQG